MSLSILPDESVVVRLSSHTVHIDATGQGIHLRETSGVAEEGGRILASFPLEAADQIRLGQTRDGTRHLYLDLHTGDTLHLGEVPSNEAAVMAAQVISEITRCKIHLFDSPQRSARAAPKPQLALPPPRTPKPEPQIAEPQSDEPPRLEPQRAPQRAMWPGPRRAEPIDKTPPRRPRAPVETEKARPDPLEDPTRKIGLETSKPLPERLLPQTTDLELDTVAARPAPLIIDDSTADDPSGPEPADDQAPTLPPGPMAPPVDAGDLGSGPVPEIDLEKDAHSTEPSMEIALDRSLGAQPKPPATGTSVPAWAEEAYQAQSYGSDSSGSESSGALVLPASPSLDEDAVATIADRPLSDFPELLSSSSAAKVQTEAVEHHSPERITMPDLPVEQHRAHGEPTLKDHLRVGLQRPQALQDSQGPEAPTDPEDAAEEPQETPDLLELSSGEPVFQQLLLESQLAAAMSPEELLSRVGSIGISELDEPGDLLEPPMATEILGGGFKAPPMEQMEQVEQDPSPTDLNIQSHQRQSKTEALIELLRFAAEQLPEAPEDPAAFEGPDRPFERAAHRRPSGQRRLG